ncbi:aldo/keto reductase [Streptomyces sp. NA02950]|uniref:aldo/keto reductase n=1 Tax=Streptomyces sp. NA02950 TaxID=2742137 RepID=UPI001592A67E|nr:aldo/keto reductase [Streptomyces sp. NA02950]QKV96391.1 aldo/keto reductase [Streptomyces sp. NA02950]
MRALGFGAATIGNLYRAITDDTARGAVDAAWDAGVRSFDTAPHYGLGLSERRLGAALADRPRDAFVLSTKVGRWLEPSGRGGTDLEIGGYDVPADLRRVWDFSADGVKRSLEASLHRLGTDRVDTVYLHDPDDHWAEAVGTAYPALADLRAQGVVGRIGVGMNQWEMPAAFVRETDIDEVMLAGRYTLLEQPALGGLLTLCAERGVSVVAAAVFNTGLLSRPEVADDARYNFTRAPQERIARAREIAAVCARHGVALPQAAIQFPLAHPAVSSVVIGCRTAEQVNDAVTWMDTPIPGELWDDLRAEGLLGPEVPVPSH